MNTKAAILNLALECNKNHIVKTALESIPYQIRDVVFVMEEVSALDGAYLASVECCF